MVMLGERVYADTAAQLRLIYKSVADNDYDNELRILVDRIRTGPMNKAIAATTLTYLDEALDHERTSQIGLFETNDAGGPARLCGKAQGRIPWAMIRSGRISACGRAGPHYV
jgi:hypothetical protein